MAALCLVALGLATSHALADPLATSASTTLAALVPADDARDAIALGPMGEVYAPDERGGWVRTQPFTISDRIRRVGRAGASVVALADGVVYRLMPNGWTAIRLAQKTKVVMSGGPRAVASVGRQLHAIDRLVNGEAPKLAAASQPILQIGSGPAGTTGTGAATSIVIAIDRGLFRVDGNRVTPIKNAPRRVDDLISPRWATTDRGALDLTTGVVTPWPTGLTVPVVAAGPKTTLVAVGATPGGLELVTLTPGKGRTPAKVEREVIAASPPAPRSPSSTPSSPSSSPSPSSASSTSPSTSTGSATRPSNNSSSGSPAGSATGSGSNGVVPPVAPSTVGAAPVHGTPVGVVVDGSGRAVIALADGRLIVRERDVWTVAEVRDELPAPKPGAGAARSP